MSAHILAGWLVARAVGLTTDNWTTTDFAFDVLSLQALFLVRPFGHTLNSGPSGVFVSWSLAILWSTFTEYSPRMHMLTF